MTDLIHETTEEAHHSNGTVAVVIVTLGFVCSACLIAAALILSAKAGM